MFFSSEDCLLPWQGLNSVFGSMIQNNQSINMNTIVVISQLVNLMQLKSNLCSFVRCIIESFIHFEQLSPIVKGF